VSSESVSMSGFNLPNLSNVSLSSVKNLADEFRAKVYPRNETERKVSSLHHTFTCT
jgi:hypothetical protein